MALFLKTDGGMVNERFIVRIRMDAKGRVVVTVLEGSDTREYLSGHEILKAFWAAKGIQA